VVYYLKKKLRPDLAQCGKKKTNAKYDSISYERYETLTQNSLSGTQEAGIWLYFEKAILN